MLFFLLAVAIPPAAVRDAEGYAVAACLTQQSDPALQKQGWGWASVIVQGGHGDPEALFPIQAVVKRELARGDVPVAHMDGPPDGDIALPVMHCATMIHRPAVRAAITRAAKRMVKDYR